MVAYRGQTLKQVIFVNLPISENELFWRLGQLFEIITITQSVCIEL